MFRRAHIELKWKFQFYNLTPRSQTLNFGSKIVEITAFISPGVFNKGYWAILKVMNLLNINIGQQCKLFADNYDAQRITRQERRHLSCTEEAGYTTQITDIITKSILWGRWRLTLWIWKSGLALEWKLLLFITFLYFKF